jgi:hypothetical protein
MTLTLCHGYIERNHTLDLSIVSTTHLNIKMEISIPAPADFHVHLRQGDMSKLVAPHVLKGGFKLAYVMVHSLGAT